MLNILKHHIIEQGLKFTEITGQVTDNMSYRVDARLSGKSYRSLSDLLFLNYNVLMSILIQEYKSEGIRQ